MPRERHFSEAEVLERAADTFSAHGYGATSMAMLCEATGLGKQSLYNTFGDKQALYLKALDNAVGRFAAAVQGMQRAGNGREEIEFFLRGLAEVCNSADPARRSCIVTNGLLEGVADAEVSLNLRARWMATHEMLRRAVERGQKDGSVRNAAPSAQLADLLMSLSSGLRVAARVDRSPARLAGIVALGMQVLDSG